MPKPRGDVEISSPSSPDLPQQDALCPNRLSECVKQVGYSSLVSEQRLKKEVLLASGWHWLQSKFDCFRQTWKRNLWNA